MKRRYFFKQLASGLTAAIAGPAVFTPRLIKPIWGKVPHHSTFQRCKWRIEFIDFPMIVGDGVLIEGQSRFIEGYEGYEEYIHQIEKPIDGVNETEIRYTLSCGTTQELRGTRSCVIDGDEHGSLPHEKFLKIRSALGNPGYYQVESLWVDSQQP